MAETVLETLSKKQIIFFGLVLIVGLSAFFVIGGTKGIKAEFLGTFFVKLFMEMLCGIMILYLFIKANIRVLVFIKIVSVLKMDKFN